MSRGGDGVGRRGWGGDEGLERDERTDEKIQPNQDQPELIIRRTPTRCVFQYENRLVETLFVRR